MTGQGPAAAVDALSAALAADPGRADLWSRLAGALVAAGRAPEAWDAAVRAVELAPGEPGSHRAVGAVAAALEDPRQAESAYRHALLLDPADTLSHAALARLTSPPAAPGHRSPGAPAPGRRRAPDPDDPALTSGRRRAADPDEEPPLPGRLRAADPDDLAAGSGHRHGREWAEPPPPSGRRRALDPQEPPVPRPGRRRAPEPEEVPGPAPSGHGPGPGRRAPDPLGVAPAGSGPDLAAIGPAMPVPGGRHGPAVATALGQGPVPGAAPAYGATRSGPDDGWRQGLAAVVRAVWLVALAAYLGLVHDAVAPFTAGGLTGLAVLLGGYARIRWVTAGTTRPPAADRTASLVTAAAAALTLLVVPAVMFGALTAARAVAVAAVTAATAAAFLVGRPPR